MNETPISKYYTEADRANLDAYQREWAQQITDAKEWERRAARAASGEEPELALGLERDKTALETRFQQTQAAIDAISRPALLRYIAELRRKGNTAERLLADLRAWLSSVSVGDVKTNGRTAASPELAEALEGVLDASTAYKALYHFCQGVFIAAAEALGLPLNPLRVAIAERAEELGEPARLSRLPVGPVTEPLFWGAATGATKTGTLQTADGRTFEGVRIRPPAKKNGELRAVLDIENPNGVKLAGLGVRAAQLFRVALTQAAKCKDLREAALTNWRIDYGALADMWGVSPEEARRLASAASLELAGAYATLPPKGKNERHGGAFPYLRRAKPTKDGALEIGFNPDFLAELMTHNQWTLTDARAVGKLGEQKRAAYFLSQAMERNYYMDARRAKGSSGRLSVGYMLQVSGIPARDALGVKRNAWRERTKGRLEKCLADMSEPPNQLLKSWHYCRVGSLVPVTPAELAAMKYGEWATLCVSFEMDAPLPVSESERIAANIERRKEAAERKAETIAKRRAKLATQATAPQQPAPKAKATRQAAPDRPETDAERKRRIARENAEAPILLANIGHLLAGEPLEKVPKAEPEDSAPSLTANSRDHWGGRKFADLSPEEIKDAQARGILLPD